MKDFRTIVINNRQEFEKLIRQNLNEGYKMINSNLCVQKPIQSINRLSTLGNALKNEPINTQYDFIYYAYMEKEI